MKELIAELSREFDNIVIDTPPVLTVTDAVLLSPMSDVTLLVTRAGITSKAALRRARDVLAQVEARLLGVVLNGAGQSDSYYYGSYGGYRSYGRYSSDNGSLRDSTTQPPAPVEQPDDSAIASD